jgi:hypothetical protein
VILAARKPELSALMTVFNNFDQTLYPYQHIRNLIAIVLMVLLHLLVAYFLLRNHTEQVISAEQPQEELLFLDLQATKKEGKQTAPNVALQAPQLARPKKRQQRRAAISKPAPAVK